MRTVVTGGLALSLLILPLQARAQMIYRWTDAAGQVHITDDANQMRTGARAARIPTPKPSALPQRLTDRREDLAQWCASQRILSELIAGRDGRPEPLNREEQIQCDELARENAPRVIRDGR